MGQFIEQSLGNCCTCQPAKPVRHAHFGNLKPIPVPQRPWQEISIDFVTGPLLSEGYDAILVVVDRLSKMQHVIRCNNTTGAPDVSHMYLDNV